MFRIAVWPWTTSPNSTMTGFPFHVSFKMTKGQCSGEQNVEKKMECNGKSTFRPVIKAKIGRERNPDVTCILGKAASTTPE